MEEVCPECGSRAVPAVWLVRLFARLVLGKTPAQPLCLCTNWSSERLCSTIFFLGGVGVETHGMCEECRFEQRQNVDRKVGQLLARKENVN